MATDIVMPRLSDTMESGTIAKWLKQEGDNIKRGDIIAEIETDKANMELESYAGGILARIIVPEGSSAGLGEPIAIIAADQAEAQQVKGGTGQTEQKVPAQVAEVRRTTDDSAAQTSSPQADQQAPVQSPPAVPPTGETGPEERVKASPLARRMAQEHGIELRDVVPTGPGGRITKDDVQSFLKQTEGSPKVERAPSTAPAAGVQAPEKPLAPGRASEPVEMSRMQTTIARRLTDARFSAPDFLLTAEYDMTEGRALLASIAAVDGAPKVGPNDLLIKAVAVALRQHPDANAGWENGGIIRYGRINVGNAVATPGGGLLVPVIADADRKSLGQIAAESKSLTESARSGKLAPAQRENGTFTISNLGMFGIDQFTSILNPPEACSLAVGAITPKPVVVDGQVVVRDRMRVTLTCDHRVINGAEGAAFLRTLRRYIEHPVLVIL